MTDRAKSQRNRLIQLIHVARRELCMDKETYTLMLQGMPQLEGVSSTADLSVPKLDMVLEQLKRRGFKVRPKAGKPRRQRDLALADDAQSRKVRSLWLELHSCGAVRDPSEAALAKFVCSMVKIDALQWLNTRQASQVIENLKKWLQRVSKAQRDREIAARHDAAQEVDV